jgi:hypothetical protein
VGDNRQPKQPITYCIDHSVPQHCPASMKAGAEAWKVAFEVAGRVDAIRALGSSSPISTRARRLTARSDLSSRGSMSG